MEINESTLQTLANYLQQTLHPDPNVRKPAEKSLENVEGMKNYPILLLQLIDKDGVEPTIRVAASITFKNFVKRNWKVGEDTDDKIAAEDRAFVKQLIVNLMLKSPEMIQKQLSDAISVIGRQDFPAQWPQLLPEMIEKFNSADFHIINGVLHTAHSLFKRYRYEFKSTELWTEIKLVLDQFAPPLTQLFLGLMGLSREHANNKDALKIIYSSLVMVAKIFYSLNFQDLPEFFEDNMQTWMDNFYILLEGDNPLLKTGEDEEAGLLEQLKSQICNNVGMYAQKYDEEFGTYLPKFVDAVWKLLVSTGNQPKYDMLVSNALEFLALVADRDRYKELFQDPSTLSSICEKVIIPNMEFRESDEELFEDNAEEYIRRDIEGSDVDTRRRAACELVRALSRHFEQQMTTIFGQYVQLMLQNYAADPSKNWKNKDAAIYLVTSLASKGKTEKHGITQVNTLVNVMEFYTGHIVPDLSAANVDQLPVLKADAVKYVMIFRNQLPHQAVKESIPFLVRLLKSTSPVVHTYAAYAIEKILLLRQTDKTALVKSPDLAPIGEQLLVNLFGVLDKPDSKENEHIMKTIMRSFSGLQEAILPFMGHLLPKLTEILVNVSKNPSKPNFNHYLFESLSLCVRIVCKNNPANVGEFEKALFPIIQDILTRDVTEFIPYTFQILTLMLDVHANQIPPPYMALFPCLLAPVLWDRQSNIHPLVQLLQAYITKGTEQILALDKLGALLGIYQKLIASKANDHEGFVLLQALVDQIPRKFLPALAQYTRNIFLLLFQRLTTSKTVKFVKNLIVFFGIYIYKYGAANFIELVDGIQAKMFGMVADRILIAETQKVTGKREKKIAAVGIIKLLCEAPQTINGDYSQYWAPLLQALIGLFELPEDTSEDLDEHFIEIDESLGYQAAFSQLVFAKKPDIDVFGGTIPDVKLYLAQSLGQLSKSTPGQLGPLISSAVAPQAQTYLNNYLQMAKVELN